jgi:acylphosphatase
MAQLQPYKIEFYIYAENEEQAELLKNALYGFVNEKRNKHIAVTANALTAALNSFKNNIFVEKWIQQNSRTSSPS